MLQKWLILRDLTTSPISNATTGFMEIVFSSFIKPHFMQVEIEKNQ